MAHAQKPDFVFLRKGRVHLNRQGRQLSTTGSRGVRISGSNAAYTMFRGSVKSTGYPFHSPFSPSLPLPCVTVCHHISTGVYTFLSQLSCYGAILTFTLDIRYHMCISSLVWCVEEYEVVAWHYTYFIRTGMAGPLVLPSQKTSERLNKCGNRIGGNTQISWISLYIMASSPPRQEIRTWTGCSKMIIQPLSGRKFIRSSYVNIAHRAYDAI